MDQLMWWKNLREIPISDFRSIMQEIAHFHHQNTPYSIHVEIPQFFVNHWCFNWSRWSICFVFFWVVPFHFNVAARTKKFFVMCLIMKISLLMWVLFATNSPISRFQLTNITFLYSLSAIDRKRMSEIGRIHLCGSSGNQNLDGWFS